MTTISERPSGTVAHTSVEPLGRRARIRADIRLAAGSTLWLSLLLVTFW